MTWLHLGSAGAPADVSKMLNRLLIGRSGKARQAHLTCIASQPPFSPWASGTPDEVCRKTFWISRTRAYVDSLYRMWIAWRLMILFRGRARPRREGTNWERLQQIIKAALSQKATKTRKSASSAMSDAAVSRATCNSGGRDTKCLCGSMAAVNVTAPEIPAAASTAARRPPLRYLRP